MGIYFYVYNLDKKEFIMPRWFSHGAKLGDIVHQGDGVMAGLALLLTVDEYGEVAVGPIHGRWAGDRLALVADSWEGRIAGVIIDDEVQGAAYAQRDGWVDISEHVRAQLEEDFHIQLPPVMLTGSDPRSTLHDDGTITPIPHDSTEVTW